MFTRHILEARAPLMGCSGVARAQSSGPRRSEAVLLALRRKDLRLINHPVDSDDAGLIGKGLFVQLSWTVGLLNGHLSNICFIK
jgi:hypothetical protein